MKKSELLEKLRLFKAKLEEHKKLYSQSLVLDDKLGFVYPLVKYITELENQRKELHRLLAILDPYIDKYSMGRIKGYPARGIEWDIYREAIEEYKDPIKGEPITDAIMDLEGIIAKVEIEAKEEIDIIKDKDYSKLFELMKLHPIIIKVSSQRFQKAQYSDAIREAFKAVENYVKEKSGKDDFGVSLMSNLFGFDYDEKQNKLKRPPILRLNKLKTKSERSEQKGYMYLFMGAMEGIRNPFSHEHIEINDPILTLKCLFLASHLLEKLDNALNKVIKKNK